MSTTVTVSLEGLLFFGMCTYALYKGYAHMMYVQKRRDIATALQGLGLGYLVTKGEIPKLEDCIRQLVPRRTVTQRASQTDSPSLGGTTTDRTTTYGTATYGTTTGGPNTGGPNSDNQYGTVTSWTPPGYSGSCSSCTYRDTCNY